MAELAWEKQLEFETRNKLINENYRLGQAVREIIKKDTDSLLFAIKILQAEIDERTTVRK